MLWEDLWKDSPLSEVFPQLFSFARKSKCSINFFLDKELNVVLFLPLTVQASAQLVELQNLIQ